jgi:two-component system cell cycle sensor histidine kinase/response regulator CckA
MPYSAIRPIAGADRSSLESTGQTTRLGARPIVWFAPILAITAGLGATFADPGRASGPTLVTLGALMILAVALAVHWRVTQRLLDTLTIAKGEIEARDRTLTELNRTAEILSAIVDSSPVAVHAFGLDRKVTIWSQASERIFGWTAEEVVGGPLPAGLMPPDQRSSSLARIERTIAGAVPPAERVRCLTKEGKARSIDIHSAPLRDRRGRVTGAVRHLVDKTELVKGEVELLQTQKMASIGLLTSGLAHDFNNTLAVAGGVAALIGEEAANPQIRADAETIIGAVERAKQLTQELLIFARETDSTSVPTNVAAVVVGLVPVLRQLVGPEIQIAVDVPERPMIVRTEAWQLEQALINLAVNARDAMPGGGRVAIAVSARQRQGDASSSFVPSLTSIATDNAAMTSAAVPDDALVEIAVRDTGCGIPAERMDRIFEPFFTTKRVGHGSGLGLAMVRRFAAAAGGDVIVESAPGLGTTVAIRLPKAHEPNGVRSDLPADRDTLLSGHASHAGIPGWTHPAMGVHMSHGDRDRNPGREAERVEAA